MRDDTPFNTGESNLERYRRLAAERERKEACERYHEIVNRNCYVQKEAKKRND